MAGSFARSEPLSPLDIGATSRVPRPYLPRLRQPLLERPLFIFQAGVTLGMVSIVAREFPDWGSEIYTLFLAMVAVHELVGPVLLQCRCYCSGGCEGRWGGARDRDPQMEPTAPSGVAS